MRIIKHVPNSLKYWKIKLDHYIYMKKYGDDIPLQIKISLVLLGPKKQVQLTLNVDSLECKKN
jgi:hypothetical protein